MNTINNDNDLDLLADVLDAQPIENFAKAEFINKALRKGGDPIEDDEAYAQAFRHYSSELNDVFEGTQGAEESTKAVYAVHDKIRTMYNELVAAKAKEV